MFHALLVTSLLLGAQPYEQGVPSTPAVFSSIPVVPEKGPFAFSHGSTIELLPDGKLLCAWYAGSAEKASDVAIYAATLDGGATAWSEPKVIADTPNLSEGNPVLFRDANGVLWLFYVTMYGSGEGPTQPGTGWTTCKVKAIASDDGGATWSQERVLIDEQGFMTRNKPITLRDGSILLPIYDERNWTSLVLISADGGNTWERSEVIESGGGFKKGNIQPALVEREDGSILCLMRDGSDAHRLWRSVSTDGGRHWSKPDRAEAPNPNAAVDIVRMETGNLLMVLNPVPEGRDTLSSWISRDGGKSWLVQRDIEAGTGSSAYPSLISGPGGVVHVTYSRPDGGIKYASFNESWVWENALLGAEVKLANLVPPLDLPEGELESMGLIKAPDDRRIPIPDEPILEHVKGNVEPLPEGTAKSVSIDKAGRLVVSTDAKAFVRETNGSWKELGKADPHPGLQPKNIGARGFGRINGWARLADATWIATDAGLFRTAAQPNAKSKVDRITQYGGNGPADSRVTAVAADDKGNLWVGTPRGLSLLRPDGSWTHITGRQGLPVEDVTAIAPYPEGLWIGTSKGAVLYKPQAEGRQWFYRQGKRYLPGDRVLSIAVANDGTVYLATDGGLGSIKTVTTSLLERAEAVEKLVNERHRRFGLVAAAGLDNADNPMTWVISDNDNDGLWTAYHVAAMALAYGATGDERYKQSAKQSMDAVIMLQNASGVPGLVARSVLPPEEGKARNESGNADRARRGLPPFDQWQPSPDGKYYWKSDTSSDEIDGHYLALYAYYRHVAQFDPAERALIRKQASDLTNYLIDNNYQLIDWTGKRTRWGLWNPENLNDEPEHYLENGLNSLQMLSFLKTAFFITGDSKFKDHFRKLVTEHGYLNNILLEKKVFPDENNHSDDQLGFVAWYPILQLEQDPVVRRALHCAVRRHYVVELPESASFFILPYGTIDPAYTNFEAAIRNLRQIPTDRRQWHQENSHRADIVFDPRIDRFGSRQLIGALPADEWCFGKWNRNPYVPDEGGDGREEDDGAAYLLPYWMARYHGFLAGPESSAGRPARLP